MHVHVSFKRDVLDLDLNAACSLGSDLIRAVGDELLPHIVDLKLFVAGKPIRSETKLGELLRDGITVLALGSTEAELASVLHPNEPIRVRNDLLPEKISATSSSSRPRPSGLRTPAQYGFGSLAPLEGFADRDLALDLLRSLAEDRGIQALMSSHRWHVPVLSEMYPDGKVGVDPVCVLGLNVNSGAEIKLRLRTDDLRGFRKILTIKKTLYHELAHNRISAHTGEFYALVSSLEREALAADWTLSTGHTTGDDAVFRREGHPVDGGGDAAPAFEGGVRRLGGAASAATENVPGSIHDRVLQAALQRTQVASGEGGEAAGCEACNAAAASGDTPLPRVLAWTATEEQRPTAAAEVMSDAVPMAERAPILRGGAASDEGGAPTTAGAAPTTGTSAPTEGSAASAAPDRPPQPRALQRLVDGDQDDGDDPFVREAREAIRRRRGRLSTLLARLVAECGSTAAPQAVETLRVIIERALAATTSHVRSPPQGADAPDERHRRIKLSNRAFVERTRGSSAAVEFLTAAGFVRRSDATAGAGNGDGVLSLPENNVNVDVACLLLARDTLEEVRGSLVVGVERA